VDRTIEVDEKDGYKMTEVLAKEELIFSILSSDGVVHAAIELSKELDAGIIVAIVFDQIGQYLFSDIFDW
jgi:cysteine synthase B